MKSDIEPDNDKEEYVLDARRHLEKTQRSKDHQTPSNKTYGVITLLRSYSDKDDLIKEMLNMVRLLHEYSNDGIFRITWWKYKKVYINPVSKKTSTGGALFLGFDTNGYNKGLKNWEKI